MNWATKHEHLTRQKLLYVLELWLASFFCWAHLKKIFEKVATTKQNKKYW
jgi:hypothetical protein